MAKGDRSYLPDQDLLLPPSLREWLVDDHLVYFVSDVVDQLDLSAIHAVYEKEKRGQPPYDPRRMTKLLVYGYCTGCSVRVGYRSGCRKTFRSKCWRRAMSRTSGPSRTFARSTSKRCGTCSNKFWRAGQEGPRATGARKGRRGRQARRRGQ